MDIVKKYAHAFINIFGSTLHDEGIRNCKQAAHFLRTHRRALFLLKVPLIPKEIKREGLASFAKRFSLPDTLMDLILVLLKHRRAFLLADILDAIVDIYSKEKNIHAFSITSALELPAESRVQIEGFLAERVQGTIIYNYGIDKKLIAGIRLQSDTLLWESSIDKQLRDILLSCEQ